MGLDPNPYTLRELFWLYDGSERGKWMHTASMMANQRACAGDKNASIQKHHPYLATQIIKSKKDKLLEIKAKRDAAKNGNDKSKDK